MGTLLYDGVLIEFEDRLLRHLQIVIVQKIRRSESFMMSWRDSAEIGDGHSAIWIHPSQNLYFKFAGSKDATINQEWVNQLMLSANSSKGLLVMKEDSSVDTVADPDIATGSPAQRRNHDARAKPEA